jgi:hypothetical protein
MVLIVPFYGIDCRDIRAVTVGIGNSDGPKGVISSNRVGLCPGPDLLTGIFPPFTRPVLGPLEPECILTGVGNRSVKTGPIRPVRIGGSRMGVGPNAMDWLLRSRKLTSLKLETEHPDPT